MKALYHPRPLALLKYVAPDEHVFAEIDPLLNDPSYLGTFREGLPTSDIILDCGVGASPDLTDPTGHTSKDPHWAVRYLGILLMIKPRVVVVPDVLCDAQKTRQNFYDYEFVFDQLTLFRKPELLYVIQGRTKAEAMREIEFACKQRSIRWVGFPRLVQYYESVTSNLNAEELACVRMEFIGPTLPSLRAAGKNVHLLGMNSVGEIIWAARRRVSMDTRMASMAALHNIDVLGPRPNGLKIDLTAALNPIQIQAILDNIKKLNDIYQSEGSCPNNSTLVS